MIRDCRTLAVRPVRSWLVVGGGLDLGTYGHTRSLICAMMYGRFGEGDLEQVNSPQAPRAPIWKLILGNSRQWDGQRAARARHHGLHMGKSVKDKGIPSDAILRRLYSQLEIS